MTNTLKVGTDHPCPQRNVYYNTRTYTLSEPPQYFSCGIPGSESRIPLFAIPSSALPALQARPRLEASCLAGILHGKIGATEVLSSLRLHDTQYVARLFRSVVCFPLLQSLDGSRPLNCLGAWATDGPLHERRTGQVQDGRRHARPRGFTASGCPPLWGSFFGGPG